MQGVTVCISLLRARKSAIIPCDCVHVWHVLHLLRAAAALEDATHTRPQPRCVQGQQRQ